MNETTTGAVVNTPADKLRYEWITPKEAENLDTKLYRNYVKLDPKTKKPDLELAKDFFFRVEGMHPTAPANIVSNSTQFYIVFEVQKYHRHKFVLKSVISPTGAKQGEAKVHEAVQKWSTADELGNVTVLDDEGNFHMEAREFLTKFGPDTFGPE